MNVEQVDWDVLDAADAIIFGCPTYMGSLSAAMKLFMEQSSKRWLARTWQGKFAAGFTNGGGVSGDKLAVLQQINLICHAAWHVVVRAYRLCQLDEAPQI